MPGFTVEICVSVEAEDEQEAHDKTVQQIIDGVVDPSAKVTAVFDEMGERAI